MRMILGTTVSLLAFTLLSACDQIGSLTSHPLVGTTYEDTTFEQGFEMAFLTEESVELRLFERTRVATCTWADTTAEAEARGEHTTFRIVSPEWGQSTAVPTGAPAAHRIEVTCPLPLGSGQFRFEMAFAQDLSGAARLQALDDLGSQLFASSAGQYDIGRTVTRVGAKPIVFTPEDATAMFGTWRSTSQNQRCRPLYSLGTAESGDFLWLYDDNGDTWNIMPFENIKVEARAPLTLSGQHGDDMILLLSLRGDALEMTASDGLSCIYERAS